MQEANSGATLGRPRLGFYASIRKVRWRVRAERPFPAVLPCLPHQELAARGQIWCPVVRDGWAPPGWFPSWRVGSGSLGWVSAKLLGLGTRSLPGSGRATGLSLTPVFGFLFPRSTSDVERVEWASKDKAGVGLGCWPHSRPCLPPGPVDLDGREGVGACVSKAVLRSWWKPCLGAKVALSPWGGGLPFPTLRVLLLTRQ